MSTIKVGLLGGGGIVDAHIRGYRAYADAIEVIAVADVVEETAERAAELRGGVHRLPADDPRGTSTPWTSACRITCTPRPS